MNSESNYGPIPKRASVVQFSKNGGGAMRQFSELAIRGPIHGGLRAACRRHFIHHSRAWGADSWQLAVGDLFVQDSVLVNAL